MHKAEPLVGVILKLPPNNSSLRQTTNAKTEFLRRNPGAVLPEGEAAKQQKAWDDVCCQAEFSELLNSANQVHAARLHAAAAPHSGAWLQALPCPNLGLHLDDDSLRIAIALRIGADVCEPHRCRCGTLVDALGHHGLSCRLSEGRHPRHHVLNDIIKRSLSAAGIPSWVEPVGLCRGDGKRPDGLTIFPFTQGKNLTWDATCCDTFCKTAVNDCAISPGAAANKAEDQKRSLYRELEQKYRFEPVAIETTGVLGKTSAKFVSELGRRIAARTGDKRETHWLRQRLSLAVVRGNATSVIATRSRDS